MLSAGVVFVGHESSAASAKAVALGVAADQSTEWAPRWDRTLFAAPGVSVPWDLLVVGFNLLSRWDAAAPLSGALARDLGTEADRARTLAVLLDLRVPAYDPRLLLVRDSSAGRALLSEWRAQCSDGGDEQLAFLRALTAIKPLFCALPHVWLAGAHVRAAMTSAVPSSRITLPVSSPNPRRSRPVRRK